MRVLRCLAVTVVLALGLALSTASGQPPLVVTFLDVGLGDCALIRTPLGQTVLVDAGDEDAGPAIYEFLRLKGIRKVDLVVATHPHAEHIGGLPRILAEYEVGALYESGKPHAGDVYTAYTTAIASKAIPLFCARAHMVWKSDDGVVVTFIWPADPLPATLNDSSVVLRLDYRGFSALFTGDISTVVEEQLILREGTGLRSDVLKVTDHASLYGSSMPFLEAVRPAVAVVSVGKNVYGHPSADVLERLTKVGARVYRTDRDGNISISSSGTDFYVSTARTSR